MIDGVGDAQHLAIERVDGRGESIVPVTGQRLERHGPHARRELTERVEAGRRADEIEQRHPGHDPERRVERVADRLGRVGGRRPHEPWLATDRAAADPRDQRAPDPGRLDVGHHEAHRQEPQVLAPDRGGERDDPVRGWLVGIGLGRHDEPLGVGRLEVRVEPEQRTGLVLDLGLVQPDDVVVDRHSPDIDARLQLVGADGPVGQRIATGHPRPDRHAASPSLSPPRQPSPVASRSSSACMNASRSPSSTAVVLPVS